MMTQAHEMTIPEKTIPEKTIPEMTVAIVFDLVSAGYLSEGKKITKETLLKGLEAGDILTGFPAVEAECEEDTPIADIRIYDFNPISARLLAEALFEHYKGDSEKVEKFLLECGQVVPITELVREMAQQKAPSQTPV
jgi:hypothetical protein